MLRKPTVLLVLSFILLMGVVAEADAQSWTSANGKFTIEAEFVQIKDGKVQLKKDGDGKLIWVDLKKLSKADQKRAMRLGDKAKEQKAQAKKPDDNDLLDQIDLECWAELKESEFSGEQPQIVVSVVATGAPAADAMQYGKLKLKKFTNESGKKLTPEKDRFSFDDISKSLKKIEREGMFSNHPEDGIAIEIKLPSDVIPETINKCSGTFSILTGGERVVESVEDLPDQFGKTIRNAALKKAKLKVEVEKPSNDDNGFSLSFNVSGNLSSLNRIWVGDADQEKLEEQQGFSNSSSGKSANYSFFFREDMSDVAVLYIETIEGAVELKVPFEFSDIEVTGR